MNISFTNKHARRFILLKQGLIGPRRFSHKQGVLDYITQAGCIQFDPIDVCGKNPELVLQSRVRGFTKQMLYDLLYKDRQLIDYFDKNLSILSTGDWKYFSRTRMQNASEGLSRARVDAVGIGIKLAIAEWGPLASSDIELNEKVDWYWSDTRLSRAALETLYFRGELVVHHKKGAVKYYDLTDHCIPAAVLTAPDPHPNDLDHVKWRVLRRISAVGLLWNKPSAAFLGIDMPAHMRGAAFAQLEAEGKIISVQVEGIAEPLYCLADDSGLAARVLAGESLTPRCELLAPLDNMLWDRRLIRSLFGFDYTWEIYTPAAKRRYGYYALPLLYGDRLIARIDAARDKKTRALVIKGMWFEPDVKRTAAQTRAILQCLRRFAKWNGCTSLEGYK